MIIYTLALDIKPSVILSENNMHAILNLKEFHIPLHLGATSEEMQKTQIVTFQIVLHFDILPPAIHTDALEDTLCYDALCEGLFSHLQKKAYHLLEHCTYETYQYLKQQTTLIKKISVTVSKNPPLSYLGQASFTLSD
jgi:dihydroneopterin aldolase